MGPFPRMWGRGQSLEGVAKALGACPRHWGVAKAVGAWPRPWGRSQGLGGVAKALEARPSPWGVA